MSDLSGFDDLQELGDLRAAVETWEQLPVLLAVVEGEDLRFTAVNRATRELAGPLFELGSPAAGLAAALSGTQLEERMREVYRTGEPYSSREWRMPFPQPDGSTEEIYLDFTYAPWRRADGSVRGVMAFAADVTASVRARQRAETRSAEWEQRFADSQAAMTALQGALLPAEVPVLPGLQIGARYLLSDADTAAGGDWFDAVPLPGGRAALIVGDVVGHGIAASAVMGRLRTVLSERLADGEPLAAALAAVDRSAGRITGADATTVCVAVVDPSTGRVEYCTAGHPPPLVARGDGWSYLVTTGAGPLGSGAGFATGTAELGTGQVLLLYSDGLVERPGRTVAQSTVEIGQAVTDALAGRPPLSGASTHPPDRVCEQSLELLTRITGFADDITVLAARRIDPPTALRLRTQAGRYAPVTVPAELERWLAAVDAGPADLAALRHAVVELVSNVVEHAYRQRRPGPVTLQATLDPDGYATIAVADRGQWREPADAVEETRARGESRFRGLGLAMVRETVDEFVLDHVGGTTARLRRRLRRPAPLLAEAPAATGRHTFADLRDALDIAADGTDRLTLRGPLHIGTAAALESRLAMETRGGTRSLTLDLSGLTHLASAGVQLLQQARGTARAHKEVLTLVAGPGTIADHVLDLVAVDHDRDVHRSADDPLWQ